MTRKVGLYQDKRNKRKPWVVRWFGEYDPAAGKQRRYTKSFRLKRDAEEFQSKRATEFKQGERRDMPEEIALGDFCKDWLRIRKPEYSSETVSLYGYTINRLLAYFRKDMPISKIAPVLASRFIAEQKRMDGKEGELSSWSRHRTLRNCKTMFCDAMKWELIAKNPFAEVNRPKLVTQDWYYLPPDEYRKLLNVAPLRWRAIYSLAYCCGLRKGELLSLLWTDIDFEAFELRIRNHPAEGKHPPFHVKDYEARSIPIPQHCLDILTDLRAYNEVTEQTPYIALNERQYKTLLAKWKRFQEQRRPWRNQDRQNNTLKQFNRHCKKACIRPNGTFALHTLRKSCITNWANEINNPEVVRRLAGHSDITTTMKYYSKVTDEQKEKAAAAIDDLLKETDVKLTY